MFKNLGTEELKKRAQQEGSRLLKSGALASDTRPHTGRSANAKFYVLDEMTESNLDWRNNKSISPDFFESEVCKFIARKNDTSKPVYRQTAYAVRDKRRSFNVDFYTEFAVHSLFVRNMFIPSDPVSDPDFKVYHFPSLSRDPKVFISLKEKTALI